MTRYQIADRIQVAELMGCSIVDDEKSVRTSAPVRGPHRFSRRSGGDGGISARLREEYRRQVGIELAEWLRRSMLDTLHAIQLSASEPDQVIYLARCQERDVKRTITQLTSRYEDGFQVALVAARDEVEDLHQVRIDALVTEDFPLDARLAAIVGAAREAMLNAARHSRSETIKVHSQICGESLVVTIRDDGVGFDLSLVNARGGFGLSASLIQRVQKVGGTVDIASSIGSGTEVVIRLPSVAEV